MSSNQTSNSSPPSGVGWTWIKERLDNLDMRKADEQWVRTKFEALEKDEDETKRIALSARKKAGTPHECLRKDTIAEIKIFTKSFSRIKLATIISLIILVAAAVAQYVSLQNAVDNTEQNVADVKISMDKLQTSHDKLKNTFEKSERDRVVQNDKQIVEIKEAVREVIQEEKKNIN